MVTRFWFYFCNCYHYIDFLPNAIETEIDLLSIYRSGISVVIQYFYPILAISATPVAKKRTSLSDKDIDFKLYLSHKEAT